MGGIRAFRRARTTRRIAASMLVACALAACDEDDIAASGVVDAADAITAVVAWQADEQEPILDDDGEPQLPVIFVVADVGTTIDVGVQADVAEATADWATVRFADDVADAFDTGLDGEPVRNDGAMLLLGPIPEPAPSIELELVRYTAVDADEVFTLEITSEIPPDSTADDPAPRATVTSVTQP